MIRWSIVCLIFLLSVTRLLAQDYIKRKELYPPKYLTLDVVPDLHKIDSLSKLVSKREEDTLKVNLLLELAECYPMFDDIALHYGLQAEAISNRINYTRGVYKALRVQAGHYGTYGVSDFDKALTIHNRMISIAEKNNWDKELNEMHSSILNLYFFMGDFPSAMNLATKDLAMAEEKSDQKRIAYYNNLLAFIYLRQGELGLARKNYELFLNDAISIQDTLKIMEAEIGLGEVLLAEHNPDSAIQVLEPVSNFLSNLLIKRGSSGLKSEKVIYSVFALAQAYRDAGNNAVALQLCLKGFAFSDSILFNKYDLANYYLITGSVYENLAELNKAKEVYSTGLKIALMIKHAEDIRDGYAALARIYARLKRYDSAYVYQQRFGIMKDSIVNVRTRSEIQRINSTYLINKKDHELEQQRLLHSAELQRQALLRNGLIAGVALTVLILVLLYNRYRLKEKHKWNQQLADQRTELMTNFINSQNNERNRLARDIHDQVGTLLSAAKLNLSDMEDNLNDEEKEKLRLALSTLDQAAGSLRSISHNLVPASLSRLGLIPALEHIFSQIKQVSSLKIDFSAHDFNDRLNENLETNLFPIVLELANNAIRHANAKNLVIQLIRYSDKVNITVEDDGVGFDYKASRKSRSGIGLTNIESRVETLRGSLNLDSIPGRGTIAMVDVPL